MTQFDTALAAGWRVMPTANGDYHGKEIFTSTGHRTVLLAKTLTREALVEAAKARRGYATMVKDLKMSYTATIGGVTTYDMGTAAPAGSATLRIQVDCPSTNISRLELVGPKGAIAQTMSVGAKTYQWQPTIAPAKGSYYYVRVIFGSDSVSAVSAPIWFD
jgi:hypothetical protein